jgi:hypothetical protein
MAAVPFGFSFGDFVAAIEIIHKAAQALRRSAGARNQIIQAAADLESFEKVLRKVQTLNPDTVNSDTLAAIRLCAYACHLPLGLFTQRIKEYERHLIRQHGSSQAVMKKIEEGYWKIKWALRVEKDVAELKAANGPGLAAIDILLQVESLEKSTATQLDMQGVKHFLQRTVSVVEQIHLILQGHARSMDTRFDRLNDMVASMINDSRKILQHMPLFARQDQMHDLGSKLDQLLTAVESRATVDQAIQIQSLLHDLASTQARTHVEFLTSTLNLERKIQMTNQKIDDLCTQMTALSAMVSTLCGSSTAAASASTRPKDSERPGAADPSDACPPSNAHTGTLDNALQDLAVWLLAIWKNIICNLFVLLWLLPKIRAQLRTCMAFVRSPALLHGNTITFTTALNRTMFLPYLHFRHFPVLECWLRREFEGTPGESRVLRGEFALFKQHRSCKGPEIPFNQWDHCVTAGDHVIMSMVAP